MYVTLLVFERRLSEFATPLILVLAFFSGAISHAADRAPKLQKSLWSCSVACESNDSSRTPLKMAHFAWCSTTVLDQKMLNGVSAICQNVNGTQNAQAVRYQESTNLPAGCISSANACDNEGPTQVGYSCSVDCPGVAKTIKYSACATTSLEAWSLANTICPGAQKPDWMGWNEVCDPNGQTACSGG